MTWLQIRLYLLMGVMFGILLATITVVGTFKGGSGTLFYIIMAVFVVGIEYLIGPAIVGRIMVVRWVTEQEEPELHRMVTELAREAKIRKPKVGISQLSIPNAFAYGSFDNRVVVTKGIRKILNKDELKAVLGHEISHVRHRDIIVITVLSVVPLILYYIARGIASLTANDDDNEGSAIAILGLLALYFVTESLVLYASRIREYYADRGSVRLGNKPLQLANALYKLVRSDASYKDKDELKRVEAVKAFFVNDPTRAWKDVKELKELDPNLSGAITESEFWILRQKTVKLGWIQKVNEVFSTHPDTLKRLKHLSSLVV